MNNGIGIHLTGANTIGANIGQLLKVKAQSGDGTSNTIINNSSYGILIDGGAVDSFIDGNIFYGNAISDLKMTTNANRISGNLIGDDHQMQGAHAIVITSGDSNAIGVPYGTDTSDGFIYGNTITNASDSAILINGGSTKDTVYGNLIENSKNGVEINGSSNNYVGEPGGPYGNTITNNTNAGIILKNQSNQTAIAANTITNNKAVNLLIDSSNTNYVWANRIDQGAIGIELQGGVDSNNNPLTFQNQIGYLQNTAAATGSGTTNTITNMSNAGVLINFGADVNYVYGNIIYSNANADISINSQGDLVAGNMIGSAGKAQSSHGIVLGNTARNNWIGKRSDDPTTLIVANTITNAAGSAILITGNPSSTQFGSEHVLGNVIQKSDMGIEIDNAGSNEIGSGSPGYGNTISGTSDGGIVIRHPKGGAVIKDNTLSAFSGIGILIDSSSNNILIANIITGGDIGIDVRGGSSSTGNTIGHELGKSALEDSAYVNTIQGAAKAIQIEDGCNSTGIYRNIIKGGGIGLVIYSDMNQIFGNVLGDGTTQGTHGIILAGASGNLIGYDEADSNALNYTPNTITNYKGSGILFTSGSGAGAGGANFVYANAINQAGTGIELQGNSSNNVIGLLALANSDTSTRGNTITGSLDKGILLGPGADANYISGNTVSTSAVADITIYSDNNQICGNTLGTDPDASNATKGAFGIILSGASGNHIGEVPTAGGNPRSNTIRNDSRAAIFVFNGSGGGQAGGNTIYGNTIQASTVGVEILGSVKTSLGASEVGTTRGSGRGNLITRSTLDGVLIAGQSNSNAVSFNLIEGVVNPGQLAAAAFTATSGIMIDGSSLNSIIGNTIRLNDNGVMVAGGSASASQTDAINNTIGNYDVGTVPGIGDSSHPSPNNTGNVITDNVHFGVMLIGARSTYIDRNLISGSRDANVLFDGSTSNQLLGNWIGTTGDGLGGFSSNQGQGVVLRNGSNNNVLGALDRPFTPNPNPGTFTSSKFGNVISGNSGNGILITSGSQRNLVAGSIIGTDRNGKTSVPNGYDGVLIINANANRILGNLIATNRIRPIQVGETSADNVDLGNITQLDS